MNIENILSVIGNLYPFSYSVVSSGSDQAIAIFQEQLDFDVIEIASGCECNGWIVPPNWRVHQARIFKDDTLIYDGLKSPLGVGVLSPSFSGLLSLSELKRHLFYSDECPDAIPYHWTNLYRPGEKDWAICMSRSLYDTLTEGEYLVELETSEEPGTMKVLDFVLPGASAETILLNGHNCHPYQANDDLSGCAVGIAVMQSLMTLESRKYTYRLVIAPELIGTVHWLANLKQDPGDFIGAIMLKSVGNAEPLKLQHSFIGDSQLDKAANNVLASRVPNLVSGAFRTIYGNDETVFDSPGYEIPSISLTRFPFKGYHTDADVPNLLSLDSLKETYCIVLELLEAMERNKVLSFSVRGLVALSHPRYGLYRNAPAPGIDKQDYLEVSRRWNLFMNCLPRELNGLSSYIDLAYKYNLPVIEVCEYLEKWVEKELAIPIKGN